MNVKNIAILSALFITNLTHTMGNLSDVNLSDGNKITFLLPINITRQSDTRLHLAATIPESFKSVSKFQIPLNSFIKGADASNWSEMITVMAMIGKGMTSSQITGTFKKNILAQDPTAKVIEDKTEPFKNYSKSSLAMVCTIKRPELFFARAYSGPYDAAVYQHRIALTSDVSEKEALKKAKTHEEENVHLFEMNHSQQ